MTPDLLSHLFSIASAALVAIGLFMLVRSHYLLRALLGLTLMEAGVNLFLVSVGYREGAAPPIAIDGQLPAVMVDPIPQALILTAIVIGVGVLGLALALALRLHQSEGTLWLPRLRRRAQSACSKEDAA